MRNLFAVVTALLLAASPAVADEMVAVKAGYLMLSPEGKVAVDQLSINDQIDLETDLGFDDSENYFVEAAVQFGDFRFGLAYVPLEFEGTGVLTRSINFNGQTFDANAATTSDVTIDLLDAGLTWYLVNVDDLPVRVQVGPELSVKVVQAEATLRGEVGGLAATETESVDAPVPTIGARARIGFSDLLSVTGRVGYLEYDDNSLLDADAQVEFSPIPMVGIFGGYRYLDVDVDEQGVFIDATFSGPYAGAFVRF
ncbi:MAG: hypothetical protein Tsb0017_27420 [Geothermobacteraceae bacterium]